MHYIFIANGRADKVSMIEADLNRQLEDFTEKYDIYYTKGIGDGIRFVRVYCDLHREEEVCFIACGGCGIVNEVASGIAGFKHKKMSILAYGATNDFLKSFPGRDFSSLKKILRGTDKSVDLIKLNDNYCVNILNVGFDANVAYEANNLIENGTETLKAYRKAITKSILGHRFNRIRVTADGEKLNLTNILLCTIGNGRWCGGQYLCCPRAELDDGLMELAMFHSTTLASFIYMVGKYQDGTYLENGYCLQRMKYRRARHIELDSKKLIYVCMDGEFTAATHFDIDIMPGELTLVLPED